MEFRWILVSILFYYPIPSVIGEQRGPFLIQNPSDQIINMNDPATLYCKVGGQTQSKISWFHDDELVSIERDDNASYRSVLPNGSLFFLKIQPTDGGVYWCQATNAYGQVKSHKARIKVIGPRSILPAGNSAKMVVTLGETAVLECGLEGLRNDDKTYLLGWNKDGSDLRIFHDYYNTERHDNANHQLDPARSGFIRSGGPRGLLTGSIKDARLTLTTTGNLMITRVKNTDSGLYSCYAFKLPGSSEKTRHHHQRKSSQDGTGSNDDLISAPPLNLIVYVKPNFVKKPGDVTAIAGEDIEFECLVRGKPDPTVIWKRNDKPIPGDRTIMTDQKSLKIQRIQATDEGTYICEARNAAGSDQATAQLTVHSRPTFVVTPRDQRVPLNGIASFDCVTTGNPAPAVYWTREGSQVLMFPDQPHGRFWVSSDGELRITGVQREDQGYYVCSALSVAGSSIAKAYLEIVPEPNSVLLLQGNARDNLAGKLSHQPPPIIARGPSNQTLGVNSLTILPCSPQTDATESGVGTKAGTNRSNLKVTWFKDETVINSQNFPIRFKIFPNGDLKIHDLKKSDTGIYTCVVSFSSTQEIGGKSSPILSTSWSAALIVESPSNPDAIFHRIPDSYTLPGPPGRPNLVENLGANGTSRHDSLELSWRATSEHDHGSSRIIGYMIEYYTPALPELGWVVAARRITQPRYVIEGLRPGTPYIFIVRAENSYGLGPPGPVSEPIYTSGRGSESFMTKGKDSGFGDAQGSMLVGIQEEVTASLYDLAEVQDKLGAPDVVKLTDAKPLTSTTIRLEWRVQKNLNYIQGFYLKYKPSASPRSSPYHTVTLMDNLIEYHLVTDLRKYTQYDFLVSPFFDAVEGAPSQILSAQTLEDVPSAPPEEVYAKVLTPTTLFITWYTPPESDWNGPIQGYRVYCGEAPKNSVARQDRTHDPPFLKSFESAEGRGGETNFLSNLDGAITFDTNSTTTSFVISNLTSQANYELRVAAFTSVGLGPYSVPLYVLMRPGQVGLSTYGSDLIITGSGSRPDPDSSQNGGGGLKVFRKPWIIATLVAVVWICLLSFGFWFYRRLRNNHKNHNKDILDDAYSYQKGTLKTTSNTLSSRARHNNLNVEDILWVDSKGWPPLNNQQLHGAGSDAMVGQNYQGNPLATCCIVDNPITQHIEQVLKGAAVAAANQSNHTLGKGINPAYKDESYSSKNRLIIPGSDPSFYYHRGVGEPVNNNNGGARSRCSTINRSQLMLHRRRDTYAHPDPEAASLGPIYETPHPPAGAILTPQGWEEGVGAAAFVRANAYAAHASMYGHVCPDSSQGGGGHVMGGGRGGGGLYATSALLQGSMGPGNTMVDEAGRIYRVEQIGGLQSSPLAPQQNEPGGCGPQGGGGPAYLYPYEPLMYYNAGGNNGQNFLSSPEQQLQANHQYLGLAGQETLPKIPPANKAPLQFDDFMIEGSVSTNHNDEPRLVSGEAIGQKKRQSNHNSANPDSKKRGKKKCGSHAPRGQSKSQDLDGDQNNGGEVIFNPRILNICEIIPPPPEISPDHQQNECTWQIDNQYPQIETPLITNNSESTNSSQSPDAAQGSLKDLLMPSPIITRSSSTACQNTQLRK